MKQSMLNPHFKVSLVSYWNTKPFLFGIQHSPVRKHFDLQLDVPSAGGKKMLKAESDIALIPVVIKNEVPELQLITEYCIGATGPVRTVCLVSNVPIEEIKEIILDDHSLTSIQLLRILLKEFWNIHPKLIPATVAFFDSVKNNTAALVIGDRSFHVSNRYSYVYDLAEYWVKLTGLPFVFAAWFSRKPIDEEIASQLNSALKFGVDHIEEVAALLASATVSEQEMLYYLKHNISYNLDNDKRRGMDLFLQKIKTLEAVPSGF